jgi:hypothetical protein
MKKVVTLQLELARVRGGARRSSDKDGINGQFSIRGPLGVLLAIQASDGVDPIAEGWEHVSVSTRHRCPTWLEMCFVKDLFFESSECVIQFHPPRSRYKNVHPYCLHLWRNNKVETATPPLLLV